MLFRSPSKAFLIWLCAHLIAISKSIFSNPAIISLKKLLPVLPRFLNISPTEFENEEKKYFPQVGDSPAVVLQKQKARETAIKALELQAGPGARQIQAHNPKLEDIAPAAANKNTGWRLK